MLAPPSNRHPCPQGGCRSPRTNTRIHNVLDGSLITCVCRGGCSLGELLRSFSFSFWIALLMALSAASLLSYCFTLGEGQAERERRNLVGRGGGEEGVGGLTCRSAAS